jgi:formiminotetrahydrofolate cyclodeaminase
MVANLTAGKPQFATVQDEMVRVLARAEALRADLLAAVDRDSEAFRRVMAAYTLPRATEEDKAARRQAIQQALREASQEPGDVIRLCREVAAWSKVAAERGNPQVLSDAAVAAVLADAGAQSAALNVKINLKSITDPSFNAPLWTQVQADLDATRATRDAVLAMAYEKLR